MNNKRKKGKKSLEMEQGGWENLGVVYIILECIGDGNKRAMFSGPKSELLSELHCIIMCFLLIILVVFHGNEFP
jgi:hypothetical protein